MIRVMVVNDFQRSFCERRKNRVEKEARDGTKEDEYTREAGVKQFREIVKKYDLFSSLSYP